MVGRSFLGRFVSQRLGDLKKQNKTRTIAGGNVNGASEVVGSAGNLDAVVQELLKSVDVEDSVTSGLVTSDGVLGSSLVLGLLDHSDLLHSATNDQKTDGIDRMTQSIQMGYVEESRKTKQDKEPFQKVFWKRQRYQSNEVE